MHLHAFFSSAAIDTEREIDREIEREKERERQRESERDSRKVNYNRCKFNNPCKAIIKKITAVTINPPYQPFNISCDYIYQQLFNSISLSLSLAL